MSARNSKLGCVSTGTILGYRDIGKYRPKAWDLRREQRQMSEEEARQALRRLAMTQATLTNHRDVIARKMYHDEPITPEDFPALMALTPKERTRILADLRECYGLRPVCDCPERVHGKHRTECSRGRP